MTGGTSGIGRAAAEAFAASGASVVIAARDAERGRAVVEDLDGEVTFFQTDVGDPDAVRHLVQEAVATYGRLDVAVKNAAGRTGTGKPTHAFEVDEFDATVDVALRGVWVGMKHQVQQMLTQDEAARQLRAHPRRSVAAVARAVGYTSRSHFSRQFKKHHGLAPSRWQREARR